MAYELKDMTGNIWPNDKKAEQKAGAPDGRGEMSIDGLIYKVSAWVTSARDGRQYYSLRIEPKEQPPAQSTTQPADETEGLPF
jgi:hypothetical protein